MTAPQLSKSLSDWDQERAIIQRNVLLRNDPRLLRIWAKAVGLRHWHTAKDGLIFGVVSDQCPLCQNGGKP